MIFVCLNDPRISSSGPLQKFYILDHYRMVPSWTIPEYYILDHSKKFTFLNIPKCLHSCSLQNCQIQDHSRICYSGPVKHLFLQSGPFQKHYISNHKKKLYSELFQSFLHSKPFPNSYILDHSRIFILDHSNKLCS